MINQPPALAVSLASLYAPVQSSFGFMDEASADLARPITHTKEICELLANNAVVAISVSGGKDSQACAIATNAHLNEIGHQGPRVLIHADLGTVEWRDSLPTCERLAQHLGLELMVVRRQAGDMLDRWRGRWSNNVGRYRDLSCVKLILPWSTPSMRFCTSELKAAPLASALRKRFPEQNIVNVVGIRREESPNRSRMPISAMDSRLTRKGAAGITWNAIIDWPVAQVFKVIRDAGLTLHEAYTKYQSSRVSCVYCIMGSLPDLTAAAQCEANQDVYRDMVELEAQSTFAFQGNRWLADVAPQLLPASLKQSIARAKRGSMERQAAESMLPEHLLFTKGWPLVLPSTEEAKLIAAVRRQVGSIVGIPTDFTNADDVMARYMELLTHKTSKEAEACLA